MTPSPFVTIAMPCLNEAAFIEACLTSVRAQAYARDRIEILLAAAAHRSFQRAVCAAPVASRSLTGRSRLRKTRASNEDSLTAAEWRSALAPSGRRRT